MHHWWLTLIGTILFTLSAASCAPAAPPAPTPAPAKPAEAAQVPKPSGNLALKVGETAGASFNRMPSRLTQDRLNAAGWKVELVEFRATDLTLEATSSGDIQVGTFQALDALRGVQAGAKVSLVLEHSPQEFVLIAKKSIAACANLNGTRFAVQSEGSPYTLITSKWMESTCGAKPNRLVISGGENRVVALMNNQLDATYVQLPDWININAQRPGEYHILVKIDEAFPGLIGGVNVVNKDWLQKNRDVALAYYAETILDARRAAGDPKILEPTVRKYQNEADVKAYPQVYEAYNRDLSGFPQNGGLTAERVKSNIDAFTQLGLIKPGLTVEQVADLSILQDALKLVGAVQGKR